MTLRLIIQTVIMLRRFLSCSDTLHNMVKGQPLLKPRFMHLCHDQIQLWNLKMRRESHGILPIQRLFTTGYGLKKLKRDASIR